MSNFLTEGYAAIVIEDAADLELLENFCKDKEITYNVISGEMLDHMGSCPKCGDSEFWSPWDQHCNSCG
jgi:hypothetical protein